MVTVVIKLSCTKGSAPDRSAHTIGILGSPILYFYGHLISDSSGTASGGKGLRCSILKEIVTCCMQCTKSGHIISSMFEEGNIHFR
jgi:hypothetical protein